MSYFNINSIKSLEDLKRAYWIQAKKHHPDTGGSETEFRELTDEYDRLTDQYLKNGNFTASEIKNEIELDEIYKEIIYNLVMYPDLKIELIGTWIWVSGNTYPIRTILKAAGFQFAPKKVMWYFNTTGQRSKSRTEHTIDQIRGKYGSKDIRTGQDAKYLQGLPKNHKARLTKLKGQFRKLKLKLKKRAKYLGKLK